MNSGHFVALLQQLRGLAGVRETAALSDRVLLARYTVDRDEAAFAALVRRHGGLVWGVCRRVLADAADADDAFQATFLVLIHKAATLRGRESIAGWLQGVAWRLARKVKAEAARRRIKETRAERATSIDFAAEADGRDLRALLDDELERLPEKYRAPLVLCYLEGMSYTEAARQLGWRDGTVCGRLARARELLRKRLGHRCLTLSVAALAALAEPATAPAATIAAVSRMARLFALGQAAGGEAVSASVSTLAQTALQAMTAAKLKATAALVVVLGLLAAGAGGAAAHLLTIKSPEIETAASPQTEKPPTEKEERTDLYGDPLPPGALLRMGTVRFRNSEFIGSVAFSPDGKIVAAGGYMGNILLYDTATGRKVRQIKAFTTDVPSLTFAPDGKTLASADQRTVQIWDVATGKEIRRFGGGAVRGTFGDYGQARLPLVFSHDGKTLGSVDSDFSIHIWDTNTGKEVVKLSGHHEPIRCIAFSPDGKTILSASGDRANAGSVRVWEIGSGKEVRKIPLHRGNAPAQPEPLCFSPDGKTLVYAAHATERRKQGNAILNLVGEKTSFLEVATEKAQPRLELLEGRFKSAGFSPDGKLLATMNGEFVTIGNVRSEEKNRIQVWEIATGKRLFDFTTDAERFGLHGPNLLAFTEDGTKLTAATWATSLHVWELDRSREHLEKPNAHTDLVQRVAYSPDGRTLATASSDHTIALWDTATGRLRGQLRGHEGPVISVAFSPDGKRLASASSHPEQSARLWDVASGKELRRYEVPLEPIGENQSVGVSTTVSFAAEGKILAAGGTDRKIRLWDVSTGKEIRNETMRCLRLPPKSKANDWWLSHVWDVAIAPDGRLMALYAAKVLSIVDSITGQALFQYEMRDNPAITVLALSPDGKTLLCGAGETVCFLEVASGAKLYKTKLTESVFGAAFSPDGRTVAVSMGEKNATILLLDVRTGQELLRLGGHGSRGRGLAFSPDGTKLASGHWDTTALIWEVSKARRNASREGITPSDLERLWTQLLDAEAPKAHDALWALVAAPDKAVPFLKEHLQPIPRVATDRLRRLIADLDADEFARREEASRELTKLGIEAEPALRKALESKPALETRRRIETLLNELTCQTETTPDALRQLRAIQVLEQIGSPQARQILASLAQGALAAPATRDAAAAVARFDLTQRAARGPQKTDRR